MNQMHKPKIVILGSVSKMPVAGIFYLTAQYLVGFERLGYEAYYVEAHARTPSMFVQENGDGSSGAANFVADMMCRLGLEDRWCFQALHSDGRCYGLSESKLKQLYNSAALIINMHGATAPRPEHYATGRLVYLGTDPVEVEIELYHKKPRTIERLAAHCAYFTWGENYGNPDCVVPVSEQFRFVPTRQPVLLDWWFPNGKEPGPCFTTIGNWQQPWRVVTFRGDVYHWSKHFEFLKFADLPRRTCQPFELALSSLDEESKALLEKQGWHIRPALSISLDANTYRDYIAGSRGEFTVAKDQNVRLRSGWFSDRSATYLAAGRPVVTQETGFSNILPVGEGLFGFSSMEEIMQAVEAINSNYEHHARAAYEIAREYFSYDVVLPHILAEVGL